MKNHTQDDLNAWRELARHHLPDWRPTLQQLQQLDEGPHELGVALRSIARGWDSNDARWDVLMGVLEYYKREHAHGLAEEIRQMDTDPGTHFAADMIDPKTNGKESTSWPSPHPRTTAKSSSRTPSPSTNAAAPNSSTRTCSSAPKSQASNDRSAS